MCFSLFLFWVIIISIVSATGECDAIIALGGYCSSDFTKASLSSRNIHTSDLSASLFGNLPLLKRVDLSNNELTYLPSTLFQSNSMLEEVLLHNNKITTIFSSVFQHNNLKILGLSNNLLTTMNTQNILGLLGILQFDISSNPLNGMFAINSLSLLSSLSIHSCGLYSIPAGLFTQNTQLEYLSLHDNELMTLPDDIFTSLANLKVLLIGNNPLSSWIATHSNFLSSNAILDKLFVDNIGFTDSSSLGAFSIGSLRTLNLGFNSFTGLPNLPNTLTNLTSLDISHNLITALPSLAFSSSKFPKLAILDLAFNKLTTLLDDVFAESPTLFSISLSGNPFNSLPTNLLNGLANLRFFYLTNTPLSSLSILFSPCSNITFIDLESNKLDSIYLSSFNGFFPRLKTLKLSHNSISTIENEFFNIFPELTEIELSDNKLETLPTRLLLVNTSSIRSIDLSSNLFSSLPDYFFDSIYFNSPSFSSVNLKSNFLGQLEPNVFGVFDTNNRTMEILLDGNPITCGSIVTFLSSHSRIAKILETSQQYPTKRFICICPSYFFLPPSYLNFSCSRCSVGMYTLEDANDHCLEIHEPDGAYSTSFSFQILISLISILNIIVL